MEPAARGRVTAGDLGMFSVFGRRLPPFTAAEWGLAGGFGCAEELLQLDVERVADSLHCVRAAGEQ